MSCRCQRRRPLDHYLIAGGPDDVESIRAFLALLPANAYGQVFLAEDAEEPSAGSGADLAALLHAPGRMTVTRLRPTDAADRATASGLATRGMVLADAITAWVAEWVPDEPTPDRVVSMWIGGRGSESVDAVCRALPCAVERL